MLVRLLKKFSRWIKLALIGAFIAGYVVFTGLAIDINLDEAWVLIGKFDIFTITSFILTETSNSFQRAWTDYCDTIDVGFPYGKGSFCQAG